MKSAVTMMAANEHFVNIQDATSKSPAATLKSRCKAKSHTDSLQP